MSDGAPREEEVAEVLQRLLAWPDIARSGQLARFLKYIVERKLRGEAQSIKAYSIAVDVFGRSPDFDPQADPIVRVQARRLRGLLDAFYRDTGAAETVRIELPTGRYVPEFVRWNGAVAPVGQTAETDAHGISDAHVIAGALPPVPIRHLSTSWFVLAAMTIGAAIFAFGLSTWGPRTDAGVSARGLINPPSVLVSEFQSLTGEAADLSMVAGLAIELVTDLDQFETIAVRYGGGAAAAGLGSASDYSLSGIVRRESGGLQYSAILTEIATGSVVWNKAITLDSAEARRADLLDYVSEALSTVLGSPRGPLHRRARALVNGSETISGGETLYACRVMFDLYRERGTSDSGERARTCFDALGETARNSGQALAGRASLMADAVPGADTAEMSAEERLELADSLLSRAVDAAPISAFVWEQRARFYELMGQDDLAEAAYSSSLQLNPASTDALAARARHLAMLGEQDAAMDLASHAIGAAPDPPAWYFCVPALEALRQGDYSSAVDYAGIYADADRELGPVLAVMAGQGLGDAEIVNRYLPRVLDQASFRANGVLTQLRTRIRDESLLRDIRVSLLSAGVPPAALSEPF